VNEGKETAVIAIIFEVTPHEGRSGDYFAEAAALKPALEKIDGFISVERFQSLTTPGKYVSLSFWRDEESVKHWRCHPGHRKTQKKGREDIFSGYRLRVVSVIRDYGMFDRAEAPEDSVRAALPPPNPPNL
jgi:heme-degrading monooxygenase HmoA